MDIQQLKYFRSVAQHGKISAAAEELFLSATALSTSISRLEKELGYVLFDRTNNRIILNRQGEIFLRYAKQILSTLDCAKTELYQSTYAHHNHVRIYCTGTTLWTDLIAAFTQEHPEITLSCSTIPHEQLFKAEFTLPQGFFLAAEETIPTFFSSEYNSMHLFDNPPMVLVHKDHPLANCNSVDVTVLKDENLLLPAVDGALFQRIQQLFHAHNLPCPSDNAYPLLARYRMVANNLGISFTTKYNSFANSLNLCTVPLEDPAGPFRMQMYWHKERLLSTCEQVFMDFARDFFCP